LNKFVDCDIGEGHSTLTLKTEGHAYPRTPSSAVNNAYGIGYIHLHLCIGSQYIMSRLSFGAASTQRSIMSHKK